MATPPTRHRLFVSGFDVTAVSSEDLRLLIGKVCTVTDLHIPGPTATGILRQFAIVVVQCDEAQVQKCVKAFNGSLWKGNKLQVEPASREYYIDRVERERDEDQMHLCDLHLAALQKQSEFVIAPFVAGSNLRVRNTRYCERVVVSSKRAKLTMFDDSGVELPTTEQEDDDSEEDEEEMETGEVDAEELAKAKAPAAPKLGGGARLGFGSLLKDVKSDGKRKTTTTALLPGTEDRDCCVETSKNAARSGTSRAPAFLDYIDVTDEEDGAYGEEEEEQATDRNHDEPCMKPEDVGEEALMRERQRTAAVLAALLGGTKESADEAGSTNANFSSSSSSTALANTGSSTTAAAAHRGWNVTTSALRYDPTSTLAESLELTSTERLSILASQRAENTRKAQEQLERANAGSSSSTGSEPAQQADLGRLKDIFSRDGGVWFGDDGTLKEAVGKGDVAQDKLFIEAEKQGFDIRSSGGSSAAAAGGMMFCFFGDGPDTFTAAAATAVAPSAVGAPDSVMTRSDANQGREMAVYNDNDGSENMDTTHETLSAVMSLSQVIQSARFFKRERTEADVIRDWQSVRDRLSLGYKRKRKDAVKKSVSASASSSTVPMSAAENRPPPPALGSGGGSRNYHGGGKSKRGGKGKGGKGK